VAVLERPVAAAPAEAGSGFDYEQALEESNPELVGMIAKAAIEQYPVDMAAIRAALATGDGVSAGRAAHSMNGTLGLFKARPAIALARNIERQARAGDIAQALEELDRLAPEVAALTVALERRLK
jgi:HPt (histidine-containing phosphotransfer) domain-containing protein